MHSSKDFINFSNPAPSVHHSSPQNQQHRCLRVSLHVSGNFTPVYTLFSKQAFLLMYSRGSYQAISMPVYFILKDASRANPSTHRLR